MTATLEAQRHTSNGQIEIPPKVCNFQFERAVKFAAVETDGKGDRTSIQILANTGEPILGHWWWGNFAIDLEGLQIGRQDKPILLDHWSSHIVGYTSKIEVTDEGILAEGTVLAGDSDCFEYGRRVKEFADEGFPWQSSVYVPPLEVEYIPRDTFVMVNGHKLEGPGHVFRKSVLREVTVTALGADENTDAEMFGEQRKELIVGKLTKKEPDVADPKAAEDGSDSSGTKSKLSDQREPKKDPTPQAKPEPSESPQQLSEVEVERNRVARLTANAEPHQHALLSQLVKDGVPLADGLEQLFADHKRFKADRLQSLVKDCPEELGVDGDDGAAKKLGASKEDRAREKFRASEELQHEFVNDEECYIAFLKLEGQLPKESN